MEETLRSILLALPLDPGGRVALATYLTTASDAKSEATEFLAEFTPAPEAAAPEAPAPTPPPASPPPVPPAPPETPTP